MRFFERNAHGCARENIFRGLSPVHRVSRNTDRAYSSRPLLFLRTHPEHLTFGRGVARVTRKWADRYYRAAIYAPGTFAGRERDGGGGREAEERKLLAGEIARQESPLAKQPRRIVCRLSARNRSDGPRTKQTSCFATLCARRRGEERRKKEGEEREEREKEWPWAIARRFGHKTRSYGYLKTYWPAHAPMHTSRGGRGGGGESEERGRTP